MSEDLEHAAARFVTVVPEIDVPGHTNAALASHPELNCDGVAPEPFTGTAVGACVEVGAKFILAEVQLDLWVPRSPVASSPLQVSYTWPSSNCSRSRSWP